MKKCGYAKGYCDSVGPCDIVIEGWGDVLAWQQINKIAKACDHYHPRVSDARSIYQSQRRRRDWRVGNPYQKEGESGKEH